MLAILARSGQYLPVCLTFGPTNGPEDFAFATDRVFAPRDLSAARTTSDDRAEAGNWPVSVCACRGWSPKRFANAYASWNRP